ncbi:hypothetical protein EUV02_11130 [Polymorphobacter arshaanensis]|uniref:Uncharacterized protein n=1 Tax=Glacieibacterium arshaanense TaxID=2511025 RepID=A0A4Y9EPA5_9SPHN|nr:hypothetical protein [Polymorphobacter arshaanensis]TFU03693.1 hypothetical protein EUV02_11130 [Polymorphobacter arshaanensis]
MSAAHRILALALLALASTATAAEQTEADAYTRYELLDPASHKFRIVYDVTATTPGATRYFNPIRPGSTASNEHVTDRATGKPLAFAEVGAAEAIAGGIPDAKPDSRWIAVTLARPVPANGGEGRIRIDKTYEDARSYFTDGTTIVFKRDLGIKRNAVLLPAGYDLIASNVPSQLLQQPDGRLLVSFWNSMPSAATLELRAAPSRNRAPTVAPPETIDERAAQNREIVYYLRDPASHSFDLTHDYTETRAGTGHYLNIVRPGSTASNPSARDLDTGAPLTVKTLTGAAAIRAYEPDAKDLADTSTAILFTYAPLAPGTTKRLRISETYTDAGRYSLTNGALVWHRSLGRPANAVVLPAGWTPTNISVPATVSVEPDGRMRIDLINPRLDDIDVLITATRTGG